MFTIMILNDIVVCVAHRTVMMDDEVLHGFDELALDVTCRYNPIVSHGD
mgnify:CR=1 FL=1